MMFDPAAPRDEKLVALAAAGRAVRPRVLIAALLAGAAVAALPALARSQTPGRASGLQVTPDGKRVLISKDVDAQRWSITRNDDGTVTGNVFPTDGGEPDFVFCTESEVTGDEVTLRCETAHRCTAAPCSPDEWTFVADVTLPLSFFSPEADPVPPGALGRRRFSIEPTTSFVRSSSGLAPPVEIDGFTGWIELAAGTPDPESGIALLEIVDAAPVIAAEGFTPGLGPTAVCIVPEPGQYPIANAGVIDCDGGTDLGYALTVDHNIGVVGVDGFTADDCARAGGTVEGPSAAHPGVCNGGFSTMQLGEDTGAGGLILAPDVVGGGGLRVRITTEAALPCGDEAVPAFDVDLVLATARTVTTVLDERNVAGAALEDTIRGENFSCARWTEEDGPGAVTFAGFVLDYTPIALPDLPFDVVSLFRFDD